MCFFDGSNEALQSGELGVIAEHGEHGFDVAGLEIAATGAHGSGGCRGHELAVGGVVAVAPGEDQQLAGERGDLGVDEVILVGDLGGRSDALFQRLLPTLVFFAQGFA